MTHSYSAVRYSLASCGVSLMTTQSPVVGTTEILSMTNVSHATFYRVVFKDSAFPKPFKIGLRKNAWLRADVEAWIAARAAEAMA